METLGRTTTHVPALPGFFVLEPISKGHMKLPIADEYAKEQIIAWRIESHTYDLDDGRITTQTEVAPITAFGEPLYPYAISLPDGTERQADGSEFDTTVADYLQKWFAGEIAHELKK